jgi:hypothetical protein
MAAQAQGQASDMGALRMDPAAQRSKVGYFTLGLARTCMLALTLTLVYLLFLLSTQLAGLDAQELLETRVLEVGGVQQPIKYASVFDRDDNMRVATNSKGFEVCFFVSILKKYTPLHVLSCF